jgi:transformation/transcription domain-associated protein
LILHWHPLILFKNELTSEPFITQAIASAKVLQVIAAEQEDSWYIANAEVLQKLVRKGMITDEYPLHDALHPVFAHLIRLFPLPKVRRFGCPDRIY